LPAIVDAATFVETLLAPPPEVIKDVLHRGGKAVYGGPSKSCKTWVLLNLALAVASGTKWLGYSTAKGRVLYMNFELQPFAVQKRLQAIAQALNLTVPSNLKLWNLRGKARPLAALLPELQRQIQGEEYALIIPDPIYKVLAGRNENDASEISEVCAEIEAMAESTGAAVAFGAHFAKGNASGKNAIDRMAGSGVWARDPDAIITATPHEEEDAFTIDMTLRNFPAQAPFVVQWEYPLMRRDSDLDPARLKRPQSGRPTEHTARDILNLLARPMSSTEWQQHCDKEAGIAKASFYRLLKTAKAGPLLTRVDGKWQCAGPTKPNTAEAA
jgi:hypothetical protein